MQHHILIPPSPPARVPMVLDTDTANEIDDQFAVVHALLSQDRLQLEAIYATLFLRQGDSPARGLDESEAEIHRLLDRLGVDGSGRVSTAARIEFLADDIASVDNAASEDLIRRAMAPRDGPLWVVAIGALTNVASALNAAPYIAGRIVIVWLGGQPQHRDGRTGVQPLPGPDRRADRVCQRRAASSHSLLRGGVAPVDQHG